jgi:hypothetical protein
MDIKNIAIALGFFEFVAAAQFWFSSDGDLLAKNGVLPASFITDKMYVQ